MCVESCLESIIIITTSPWHLRMHKAFGGFSVQACPTEVLNTGPLPSPNQLPTNLRCGRTDGTTAGTMFSVQLCPFFHSPSPAPQALRVDKASGVTSFHNDAIIWTEAGDAVAWRPEDPPQSTGAFFNWALVPFSSLFSVCPHRNDVHAEYTELCLDEPQVAHV